MTNTALVIVDVQRDFLDPTTPAKVGSWQKAFCVRGVRTVLDHARTSGWQVIHVGTRHASGDTLPTHHRRLGIPVYCRDGGPGCEFVVTPNLNETVLFKTWYSAFADTGLLERLSSDITEIVWGGVATDCCIQQSVFDADRHGIRSIVPLQAVSASSAEAHVASLIAIAKSAGEVRDAIAVVRDGPASGQPIEIETVRQLATEWFAKHQLILEGVRGHDLEAVLHRLSYPSDQALG